VPTITLVCYSDALLALLLPLDDPRRELAPSGRTEPSPAVRRCRASNSVASTGLRTPPHLARIYRKQLAEASGHPLDTLRVRKYSIDTVLALAETYLAPETARKAFRCPQRARPVGTAGLPICLGDRRMSPLSAGLAHLRLASVSLPAAADCALNAEEAGAMGGWRRRGGVGAFGRVVVRALWPAHIEQITIPTKKQRGAIEGELAKARTAPIRQSSRSSSSCPTQPRRDHG